MPEVALYSMAGSSFKTYSGIEPLVLTSTICASLVVIIPWGYSTAAVSVDFSLFKFMGKSAERRLGGSNGWDLYLRLNGDES